MNRDRVIMINVKDEYVFHHQSKNMKFHRVFDLISDRYIIISSKQKILWDLSIEEDIIEIYVCALFKKADYNVDGIFAGHNVYFQLKKPNEKQLQTVKDKYPEHFI